MLTLSVTLTLFGKCTFSLLKKTIFEPLFPPSKGLQGSGLESPFVFTMIKLFKHHDLEASFSIPSHALNNFMTEIENGYKDNPYHNSYHAMDVTLSLHFIITKVTIFGCGFAYYCD
jgi:hypothetical protein